MTMPLTVTMAPALFQNITNCRTVVINQSRFSWILILHLLASKPLKGINLLVLIIWLLMMQCQWLQFNWNYCNQFIRNSFDLFLGWMGYEKPFWHSSDYPVRPLLQPSLQSVAATMASELSLSWDGSGSLVDAGVDDDKESDVSRPPSSAGRSAKRKATPKPDNKRRKKADEVEYLSTSFTSWRKTPDPWWLFSKT